MLQLCANNATQQRQQQKQEQQLQRKRRYISAAAYPTSGCQVVMGAKPRVPLGSICRNGHKVCSSKAAPLLELIPQSSSNLLGSMQSRGDVHADAEVELATEQLRVGLWCRQHDPRTALCYQFPFDVLHPGIAVCGLHFASGMIIRCTSQQDRSLSRQIYHLVSQSG